MNMVRVINGSTSSRAISVELNGDGWLVWTGAGHLYFRRLDFDCDALGLEAARVEVWQSPRESRADFVRRALALAAERFQHVTWKVATGDRLTREAAIEAGFRRIVVNQAFCGPLVRSLDRDAISVRRAESGDRGKLSQLCAEVFCEGTRYHRDPDLPQDRIPDLYRGWMENSLAGYADLVLVAGEEDISGFLTARYEGDTAYVDLFGVAQAARCTGVGKALFGALGNVSGAQVIRVAADTEEDNLGAVSFYTAQGLAPGARTDILQIGMEALG